MSTREILLLFAVLFFVLAAFGVPRVNWRDLGFAAVTASLLV